MDFSGSSVSARSYEIAGQSPDLDHGQPPRKWNLLLSIAEQFRWQDVQQSNPDEGERLTAVWRPYEEKDRAEIVALHEAMQRRLNCVFDIPLRLEERPVLNSQVRVVDGKITHCVFIEAEVEVCSLGEDPLPAKEWVIPAKRLAEVCAAYEIRLARAFIPAAALGTSRRGSAVERILKRFGFVREDEKAYAQYVRWVA
jgi:hypothetical protein